MNFSYDDATQSLQFDSQRELSLPEIISLLGEKPVLLQIPWGEKGLYTPGWTKTTYEHTQSPDYQKELLSGRYNVGVLLGPDGGNLCTVDVDCDDLKELQSIFDGNSWIHDTLITRGQKGCQIWFRLEPGYPFSHQFIHSKFRPDLKHVAEFRAKGCQSVIWGKHPNLDPDKKPLPGTLRYTVLQAKGVTPLRYEDIQWPSHWFGQAKGARAPEKKGEPEFRTNWTRNPIVIDRQKVAETLLGEITWEPAGHAGFCTCPAVSEHNTKDGDKDCKVFLGTDARRTVSVHCLHASCEDVCALKTQELITAFAEKEGVVFYLGTDRGHVTFARLYQRLAESGLAYRQAGMLWYEPATQTVKPVTEHNLYELICSAEIPIIREVARGDKTIKVPTQLDVRETRGFLYSSSIGLLPQVDIVSACHLLYLDCGAPSVTRTGYNPTIKALVTCTEEIPVIPFDEGLETLSTLIDHFKFETPEDRSRAFAGMLTPNLHMAGMLGYTTPPWIAVADQPNSGKTFFQQLVSRMYNHKISPINQGKENLSIGAIEEKLQNKIRKADPFIQIDNVRGNFDLEFLESLSTTNGQVALRTAYFHPVDIDIPRFQIMLTGNVGFTFTEDQASRSNITHFLLQPGKIWEMDGRKIDDLVDDQWAYYLGCIHAVLRQWMEQGCPKGEHAGFRFHRWAEALDGIIHGICGWPKPTANLKTRQRQLSNPALNWLTEIMALTEKHPCYQNVGFRALDLFLISQDQGLDLPIKVPTVGQNIERLAAQALGKKLSSLLGSGSYTEIPCGFLHSYTEKVDRIDRSKGQFEVRFYYVSKSRVQEVHPPPYEA